MDPHITTAHTWSFTKKQLFRFWGIYFFLYMLPFIPLVPHFNSEWDIIVTWLGKKLKIWDHITVYPNGSGDTTYNYLQVLWLLIFAFASSIIWGIVDRKRKNYDKLLYWLLVLTRYTLALIMIGYGFAKIFKTQFPAPNFKTLSETYGASSPMRLAWTFMGASLGFNLFTGICEALGGFLLFFRRTALFGSLFSMTVLSNIVAMNFCYDIPVKLFSIHLLLLSAFIALPEIPRLMNFFFYNKPVAAANRSPFFKRKWMRITRIVLKSLFIGGIFLTQISDGLEMQGEYGDNRIKPPLYGMYEVQYFIKNNDTLKPNITDTIRWKKLMINFEKYATIMKMNDTFRTMNFVVDTNKKAIYINREMHVDILKYQNRGKELYITGFLLKDSLSIGLIKKAASDFLLINRGFHWINEYPFNK